MKVAIASINLQWQSGGSRQVLELARHLQASGDTVVIYAPESNRGAFAGLQQELDVRAVPAVGGLKWKSRQMGFIKKVAHKVYQHWLQTEVARRIALVMDADFDVLNCHDFAYKVAYFYKQRNPSVRAVWTMNEPPFSHLPKDGLLEDIGSRVYNAIKDVVDRKFIRAADVIASPGVWETEWAKRRGVPGRLVWSGLDFSSFYAPIRKHPAVGPVRLLSIGIPNKYRRFGDVIEAVRLLREEGMDVRFTLVAKNIWEEDTYCAKLTDAVRTGKLDTAVDLRFEGVSEEELRRLYRTSHVFVCTNYVPPGRNGATWALVVSEAMAAGMPVVLYRNTGAAEPLTDNKNVLLTEPFDPRGIADAVQKLVRDPDLFVRIARDGQAFVKENISWERYAKSMRTLFAGR